MLKIYTFAIIFERLSHYRLLHLLFEILNKGCIIQMVVRLCGVHILRGLEMTYIEMYQRIPRPINIFIIFFLQKIPKYINLN